MFQRFGSCVSSQVYGGISRLYGYTVITMSKCNIVIESDMQDIVIAIIF